MNRPATRPLLDSFLPAALLAAAAVALYANSFAGVFVFDDLDWIDPARNPAIEHFWSIGPLFAPGQTGAAIGRPVVSLTLAANYAIGGMDVWGYHAVNLAIHILAAWTLFGVLRRTLLLPKLRDRFASAATPLALVAALLWTVHPFTTAAVTYVIQRSESLLALFYLLTLYCVIRGAEASTGIASGTHERRSRRQPQASSLNSHASLWFFAAVAACLLGMMTKEVMVTAPLAVLLYDRTFLAGSFRRAIAERSVLYLALSGAWGVGAWLLYATGWHGNTVGFAVEHFSWWSYLRTQPSVIAHYLWTVFWPEGLALDYGWPRADTFNQVVWPGLVVVGLLGLTILGLIKRPALGFVAAMFFLILAPTSSFVPIKDAAFDHRMYLPLASVLMLLVLAGYSLRERLRPHWLIPLAILLTALFSLGRATVLRNEDYHSELAIWQDAVAKRPDNARGQSIYANALFTNGRIDEAIQHWRRAIEIDPDFAAAHANLAKVLDRQGNLKDSVAHWRAAARLQPDNVDVLSQAAWALATSPEPSLRDGPTAVKLALHAVELPDGRNASRLMVLAAAYAESGRFPEATETARQAIEAAVMEKNNMLAQNLRSQRSLYLSDIPFHQPPRPHP